MAPATPFDQWTVVLGFFMPLLISFINQSHWKKDFKTFVAFMACVTAAAVQLGVEGRLDAKNFFPTVLALSALSTTFFHHFWKPIGAADSLEKATDFPNTDEEVKPE